MFYWLKLEIFPELQRGYSEGDAVDNDHGQSGPMRKGRKTIKSPPNKPPRGGGGMSDGEYLDEQGMVIGDMSPSQTDRSDRSGNHLSPEPEGKKKERGKSPFR